MRYNNTFSCSARVNKPWLVIFGGGRKIQGPLDKCHAAKNVFMDRLYMLYEFVYDMKANKNTVFT